MMSGNGSSRTGLEPMRALRNAPVEHFSEAVSLQGRCEENVRWVFLAKEQE